MPPQSDGAITTNISLKKIYDIKASIAIQLIILTSSLVVAQKITADVDDAVDFTKYKSYQFLGWQDDSDRIINDLGKTRLLNSFEAEFAARELEEASSDWDLAICVYDKVDVIKSDLQKADLFGFLKAFMFPHLFDEKTA